MDAVSTECYLPGMTSRLPSTARHQTTRVHRVGMVALFAAALFAAQSGFAKNPPKLKGKTPPDTFVVSEPEYFPAVSTPGLTAPTGYDEMNVDEAKKQRYSDLQPMSVLSRRLSSTAQSWWQ